MSVKSSRIVCLLTGLLMVAVLTHAGGTDPREMQTQESVVSEKVTATPEQTSTAVSKARRAVVTVVDEAPKPTASAKAIAPTIKAVTMTPLKPKTVPSRDRNSWLLGSREGECAPLSSVSRKVKNIGTFKTPQEFSRKLHQRGYQAFVLDIGDVRDQMMRVKVPDLDLDLTFVKAELCR